MIDRKLRYSSFAHRIDVDAFEQAIDFDPIRQDGENDAGYCILPYDLHKNGDRTGKFAIHREKRVYNCFVCGGGNLLDLVVNINGWEIDEATNWLYQFADYEETDEEFQEELERLLADPEEQRTAMPYFNDHTLDRWEYAFDHPWIVERGISKLTVAKYGVRYTDTQFRRSPIEDEGDYIGPALIFPHYWRGRLVGWQNRWLAPEEERPKWVPKYTNTHDLPKTETIFGYDEAMKEHTRHGEIPVVVESVPTTLFLDSNVIPGVATFGSDISEDQLRLLRNFETVILAPDNDKPGSKWLKATTEYLERFINVMHVPAVDCQVGADLGDLAKEPGMIHEWMKQAEIPLGL